MISFELPGVGAFKDCMANLNKLNLIDPIRKFIDSGKPFLGICLGQDPGYNDYSILLKKADV